MPRNTTITPMCLATLKIIIDYHAKHRYSPSYRNIATKMDELRSEESDSQTSTSTVSYHVRKLIEMGYLEGDSNLARSYAPTELGRRMAESMVQENHAYLCSTCNLVYAWYQVQKNGFFLICPKDGNVVIDVTDSDRGKRFLQAMERSTSV